MKHGLRRLIFRVPTGSGGVTGYVTLTLILALFTVVPISIVLGSSLYYKGQFDLIFFKLFFESPLFLKSLNFTLASALYTALLSSALGVPLAFFLTRYEFRGRSVLFTLSTVPLVLPPFVGALALIMLLNPTSGIINLALKDLLGLSQTPINIYSNFETANILGFEAPVYFHPWLVIIQSLHLFPLILLTTAAALSKVDPSLEESAVNLGATSRRLFRTITFPLARPGYLAGLVLVFVWALSDLGTPLVLNFQFFLPFQAYHQMTAQGGIEVMGLVISVILLASSVVSLLIVRRYVSLKQYAVVSVGKVQATPISGLKLATVLIYSISLIGFSLLPHAGIFYGALLERGTANLTLSNFSYVIETDLVYFFHTFRFGLSALVLAVIIGITTAYILVRKKILGKSLLDSLTMIPFAVPGVVVGIGFLTLFRGQTLSWLGPALPLFLAGVSPIPVVTALAIRRSPYMVRSAFASLQQIHPSYEEASMSLGASRLRTVWRITLRLMIQGIFAGIILSFINIITEVSSSIFLLPAGELTVPVAILLISQRGDFGEASALAAILIVVIAAGIFATNKLLKQRVGAAFGG